MVSRPDMIFANGFESGDLSGWSSSITDNGDLGVSKGAALVGSYGLQAKVNDSNPIYVEDDTPSSENRYRARFYFDPNSITMTEGDTLGLFGGYTSNSDAAFRVDLVRSQGDYRIQAFAVKDDGTAVNTSQVIISNAPHMVEMDWQAASATGALNGSFILWVDGAQVQVTGIDNDALRIEFVRLGVLEAPYTTSRGKVYFDSFESHRQSAIGPDPAAPTPAPTIPEPTSTQTMVTATSTPQSGPTSTPTLTPASTPTG